MFACSHDIYAFNYFYYCVHKSREQKNFPRRLAKNQREKVSINLMICLYPPIKTQKTSIYIQKTEGY